MAAGVQSCEWVSNLTFSSPTLQPIPGMSISTDYSLLETLAQARIFENHAHSQFYELPIG